MFYTMFNCNNLNHLIGDMDFLANIPEKLKRIVQKVGLESPQQLLCASNLIFLKHGCNPEDISLLKNIAAKYISPGFTSVNDLITNQLSKWSRISFGCQAIDACTGGIQTRGITEISGESGSGKTQLVLQLSIMVQLPKKYGGLEKAAVFITTENALPSDRLFQIAEHYKAIYRDVQIDFLQNIYVQKIMDSEAILKCVMNLLPILMEKHSIGLIIIDSVAAIYRIESNFIARANEMRKLASKLLTLCDKYSCAIVCINQISSTLDELNTQVPCLGLAWTSLVRTRLMVSKTGTSALCRSSHTMLPVRQMKIIYSPVMANNICKFLITSQGIVDLQ